MVNTAGLDDWRRKGRAAWIRLGPKKRRELLKQFGGLQAVTRAGIDDLTRVKGISQQLAAAIYEHFHAD